MGRRLGPPWGHPLSVREMEGVQLVKFDVSRRRLLQVMGATALSASVPGGSALSSMNAREIASMPGVPKIAIEISTGGTPRAAKVEEASMRRAKQLGVNDVLTGGPPIPWQEDDLRAFMERLKGGGLSLGNMMIAGFPKTVSGKSGRDEEIDKVLRSIRVAGKL